MVRKLAWTFAGLGLLCATALGQPPEAAPKPTIRLLPNYVATDIPKGGPPQVELPPVPQPLPKILAVEPRALPSHDHLALAADHLEAAGLKDEAAKLRERAARERMSADRQWLTQTLEELKRLQSEVDELRQKAGEAERIKLQLHIVEIDHDRLKAAGIELPPLGEDHKSQSIGGTPAGAVTLIKGESLVRALREGQEAGAVQVLARPAMTTISGRPASSFSGGKFPIPNPQGDSTVEWMQYGVSVQAVPRLLSNGKLRLEIQPEISTRDFTNCIQVAGETIPTLQICRVSAQVEVSPGETCVLSGMRSTREVVQASGEKETRTTELLFLLDATVLQPSGGNEK